MEHRNSTVIIQPDALGADADQIGALSHEFFHSWNVERLRPAELEPFDFTRANPTPSLWLAEGFTNYYGPLAILRSGVGTLDQWMKRTVAEPVRRDGEPGAPLRRTAGDQPARALRRRGDLGRSGGALHLPVLLFLRPGDRADARPDAATAVSRA
ncbi:hypothetical protein AB5I41_11585 [Sphingomonas sp. MMS24-JH45]